MSCEALFFTAPWCNPCRQAAPIFSEVMREANLPSTIVDVDLTPDLADRFGVERLPTLVIVSDGVLRGSLTGSRPKAEVRSFVDSALGEVDPPVLPTVAD
ncbi:thioredoxin family protein [Flaviflexus equikiangi]|uniref:Thioredoxin family protein n=1 Tax=Flaviflexus equikiangi TaxID=2758573 RepID=A0ABS2TC01_9ACTO|nr:thioredoxin family protein [Flaviflexus equikiangi]MBM9432170.1 thioredoxin family protein [Flaviflexus equikiangi]